MVDFAHMAGKHVNCPEMGVDMHRMVCSCTYMLRYCSSLGIDDIKASRFLLFYYYSHKSNFLTNFFQQIFERDLDSICCISLLGASKALLEFFFWFF